MTVTTQTRAPPSPQPHLSLTVLCYLQVIPGRRTLDTGEKIHKKSLMD